MTNNFLSDLEEYMNEDMDSLLHTISQLSEELRRPIEQVTNNRNISETQQLQRNNMPYRLSEQLFSFSAPVWSPVTPLVPFFPQYYPERRNALTSEDEYDIYSQLTNVKVDVKLKDLIYKTTTEISNKYIDDNCTICLHPLHNEETPMILRRVNGCHHIFHINCIDKWFTESNKCPVCRFEVTHHETI